MEVIGYGVNGAGVQYWIAKNSFGAFSGIGERQMPGRCCGRHRFCADGFYLIARGINTASIETRPYTAPVVAGSSAVEPSLLLPIHTMQSDYQNESSTGAAIPISADVPLAKEAAEFAARNVKTVHCNGAPSLLTVGDVSVQPVAGALFRMTIVVGGANCDHRASFYTSVYYNVTSGNFSMQSVQEFMTVAAVVERATANEASGSSGAGPWQNVGIGVGVVATVGLIAFAVVLHRRRRASASAASEQTVAGSDMQRQLLESGEERL
jgi:hypothetical protein